MILNLHRQGAGVSVIARRTGLDRKTVRKIIASGLEPPVYGPRPPRVTRLRPFEAYLRERLAAVPELTRRRLHRELGALGYRGGYTAVTDLLRKLRPAVPPPFELRFETPAGQQAQVDFAQFQTEFGDEPGVVRIVWLFSLALGHSRMLRGRFVLHQDLPTVLRCHIAAFEALGGVPQQILYDRMKTAVIREGKEAGHIVYNRTLLDFARHHGFLPKACRPYRAKTKGKVERPFRYVREDFLFLGSRFRNLDDLNTQFRQWQDEVRQRPRACHHPVRRRRALRRGASASAAAAGRHVPGGAAPGAADHPRRHGLGRRQSLQRAQRDPPAPGGGPHHRRRGAHSGRRAGDRRHPVLEGRGQRRIIAGHRSLPPPANSHTPRQGAAAVRAGETVTPRPLAFYDAVARRLAAAGPLP